MSIVFRQTVQIDSGKEICFEICRDGTVIVSGASKIKLLFPYEHTKSGLKLIRNGSQEKGNELFVEARIAPNATWDFEVVLWDRGTLLKTNPHAMVVDITPDEKAVVYAQDGIGDWSKQFAF